MTRGLEEMILEYFTVVFSVALALILAGHYMKSGAFLIAGGILLMIIGSSVISTNEGIMMENGYNETYTYMCNSDCAQGSVIEPDMTTRTYLYAVPVDNANFTIELVCLLLGLFMIYEGIAYYARDYFGTPDNLNEAKD